jgi:hypothetical protein
MATAGDYIGDQALAPMGPDLRRSARSQSPNLSSA